ncbi:DUF1674 domain-containing protein [Arvimicrobium flavum]|uniref:DUF1674 domain-containing protein n=1 Tax=Arvimicrobium flavum TaxID=3393320 RepID=UPI00237A94A5|nr:DUF1674 domain-containing protein [Mesorhizobium shangrilense]
MNNTPEARPAPEQAPDKAAEPSAERTLTPAARRALQEAEQRRAEYEANEARLPKEIGGRKGPEPGRYGDWEVKGLTSDF